MHKSDFILFYVYLRKTHFVYIIYMHFSAFACSCIAMSVSHNAHAYTCEHLNTAAYSISNFDQM